ncbi:hypothetical protein L2E82_01395 [Cichorium intybus]|uniref:Uncharacterized protein n=1 Tax=Cichorium intybus TaxID=13427 RepID=A0ACB9GZJ7_CICIN|nr:hypothetical protein L2E82_01395 [Cichorium intybus]
MRIEEELIGGGDGVGLKEDRYETSSPPHCIVGRSSSTEREDEEKRERSRREARKVYALSIGQWCSTDDVPGETQYETMQFQARWQVLPVWFRSGLRNLQSGQMSVRSSLFQDWFSLV